MSLIAMIQKKVVDKDGLMDNDTIMEGISWSSMLPGPMAVNVVSFVGYRLGGIKGVFVSIFAVLLPSFILMLVLSHFIFFPTALVTKICTRFFGHLCRSAVLVAVFKTVRPSIIGMIASAAFTMMINNGITLFAVVIFTICVLFVMRVRFDPVYVIPAAGIAGLLLL